MPKKEIIGKGPGGLPFPEGVLAGETFYLSGMIGVDMETGKLVEGGVGPETKKTIETLTKTLTKAGMTLENVVKVVAYLKKFEDFPSFNEAYADCFRGIEFPARETIAVADLVLGASVELSFIAVR
jgi:2-iminobutanoate/2-iminopropanoate deaminase